MMTNNNLKRLLSKGNNSRVLIREITLKSINRETNSRIYLPFHHHRRSQIIK